MNVYQHAYQRSRARKRGEDVPLQRTRRPSECGHLAGTPAYKRWQNEREAAKQGRVLPPYLTNAERLAERPRTALLKWADRYADRLRKKFYAAENRRMREVWHGQDSTKHEYLERQRVSAQQRYTSDPARERQRVSTYKHAHPEKVALIGDRRQQRAALYADGSLTPEVVGQLFGEAKSCPYCERKLGSGNKSLDHIIALSLGGAHAVHNVLISCRECNLRKRALTFAEWVKTLSASCERRATRIYRQRYGCEPQQAALTLVWSKVG